MIFPTRLMPVAACFALCMGSHPRAAGPDTPGIYLNQVGYLPGSRKLVAVEGEAARAFRVVRIDTAEVVLEGRMAAGEPWEPAGLSSAIADVSDVTAPGRYRLVVDGLLPSEPFAVDPKALTALTDAALKGLYFNRASTQLEPAHAGPWARAAGHPDDEVEVHASAASASRPAGTVIAAPRGWYDAGDYNKYVVNSGITTYTLLAALEHFPLAFRGRDIGIPESGDAVPDILDEARWNLLWMLDMQDPADGGVYHKLTNLRFDGKVMPAQANTRRYVVQKTTAATLDFAAVMAVASRVHGTYAQQFPGAAERMRRAAEAAWRWAEANPTVTYRQPPDVQTGAYGDRRLEDEFTWAAAELFLLTGDEKYLHALRERGGVPTVPSWSDVGGLAWISLTAASQRLPAADGTRITHQLLALADDLAAQWRTSPWRVTMQRTDFVWGSNAVALNQAIVLLQGHRLTGEREYLDAAQSQLDYVLGRNPLGVSFVTGHGLRTPQHIHHRPSQADGVEAPVPGLLAGGPNPGRQDARDCPVPYASSQPALAWLDHGCSYASNEIAINWNAPLVYVAAGIESLTGGR